MNEEHEEKQADGFDIQNDRICEDRSFEAKMTDTVYERIKNHVKGKGYTYIKDKHTYACRD